MKFNEIAVLDKRRDPVVISDLLPGRDEVMESGLKCGKKGSMGIAYPSFVGVKRAVDVPVAVAAERKEW